MGWRVYAAAAIGSSHIEGGIPCQDAFAHTVVGDTLLAVVCDGAGSQSLSDIGAQTVTRHVVDRLAERERGQSRPSTSAEADFASLVAEDVASAREKLLVLATEAGAELSSYSCTLVGVVANAEGGRFFHIGDGLGVAETPDPELGCVVSKPENGEYANETYFVSGEAWREHLRVTPFAMAPSRVALMSDGAMPFAMAKGNGALFRPFMDPVEKFLASVTEDEGSAALAGTLGDARTHGITSDDKTLLIALWR